MRRLPPDQRRQASLAALTVKLSGHASRSYLITISESNVAIFSTIKAARRQAIAALTRLRTNAECRKKGEFDDADGLLYGLLEAIS